MIYAAVCLAGVVCSVLSAVVWFRRKNILEAAVIGIVEWFFAHIFASIGLFLIDRYTIFRAGFGAAVICAAALAAALYVRRSKPFRWKHYIQHDFSIKDMLIPIIVCILAVPFVSLKNEYFGMGQDQGVYQTQAIMFINGDTKRQKDFEEYYELDTDSEREFFKDTVSDRLGGYDIIEEDHPDTEYDRSQGDISGLIHGIPAYTALLAMWGKLFGISNMQGFETILYVCFIFIVFFICRNLRLKKTTSACACAAAAFSPVVIWSAKASLTEMLLALVPVVFLYFLTDDEEPQNKVLSIIPVFVFGCYHVSIYTMLPMFIMIYGGMYIFERRRGHAVCLILTALSYPASFFIMRHIQPHYTMNNYSPVFGGGINVDNITLVVSVASAVLIAAAVVFVVIVKKRTSERFSSVRFSRGAAASKGFLRLLRLMLILPCVLIVVLVVYHRDNVSHNTLVSFIGNAGLVLLPLGMIIAVARVKFFAEKTSRLVLFIMFFYCVLIYSAFLRREIQYYYYYDRYLVPFIAVAVIFAAAALDKNGAKLMIPVTAAGLLFVARYDLNLMANTDDSRVEWSVLEDLADHISENDCVVISDDYDQLLRLPLKSMTGARFFPEDPDDEGQIERLAKRYGRVSVLTKNVLDTDDYSAAYFNVIHSIEDDLNNTGKLIPFSKSFYKTDKEVRLYAYEKQRYYYLVSEDYASLSGVSDLETTFCWTDSGEAALKCSLSPDDYDITVELGCEVPLDKIGKDSMEVKLLLNGKEIGSDLVTDNNTEALLFSADKELVNNGENILGIECPLWEASVSNPDDSRTLGIPLKSVRFTSAS